MKNLTLVLLFFLAGCTTTEVGLPWDNARIGMTIKQVQATFPGCFEPTDPSPGGRNRSERLRLLNYSYLGNEYKVRFIFEGERLVQIMMNLHDIQSHEAELENIANSIEQDLSKHYGKAEKSGLNNVVAHSLSLDWEKRSKRYNVTMFNVNDEALVLNVNYMKKKR